ncbi:MAG: hypothetical protein QXM68_01520 [Candidatus Aenigmatarchaeota archaeon]|nr:hypothetical protein [Candidatus Aenigmarchaeota archaeon]
MKGVSFITYLLVSASSLILFIILFFIFQNFYTQYISSLKQAASREISVYVENEIINLYNQAQNSRFEIENQSFSVITKKLNIPQRIAGEKYYIEAIASTGLWNYITYNETTPYTTTSNKILVKFLSGEEYYYDLTNINVTIQGILDYENSAINYVKFRINGEVKDAIVFGNNTIFFDIEKIQ